MLVIKAAGDILETVLEDGEKELQRASTGLALSGFATGLNISFGAMDLAVVGPIPGAWGLPRCLPTP